MGALAHVPESLGLRSLALDELLVIAARDRKFGGDIARKTILAIVELCPDAALVSACRRKLSASLY